MAETRVQRIVRGKISMPTVPPAVTPRPRLVDLIHREVDTHSLVLVVATAGSGKTTAVADALSSAPHRVAWLHLDAMDGAAGRMLLYLGEALRSVLPDLPELWRDADGDITHAELAGLLAEAVGEQDLVLVVDEAERLASAKAARETLAAFARYAAPTVRIILISRQDIDFDLLSGRPISAVGRIGEHDLAFTVDEAGLALAAVESKSDPGEAVAATGGWVTGVLFDAWRSDEHVHGTGGETDPLHGYLSTEIMARLPQHLAAFLIETSVLDVVTPMRVEALGITPAGELVAEIVSHHLPVSAGRDHEVRYHPRFREFLLARLQLADSATQRRLHFKYAELLVREGRVEEAVDEFLRAGEVAEAEDLAASIVLEVARRLDVDVVARWLGEFRRWRVESSVELTSAELLVALEREQYGVGARCADRLRRMAEESEHAIDSGLRSRMAWCYFLIGRLADATEVLRAPTSDPRLDAMRYIIGVELVDDPITYAQRPNDPPSEFAGFLSRSDLVHGRYQRVLDHPGPARGVVRLSQMGALTGLGRLEEAQAVAAEIPSVGWTAVRLKSELMAESRQPERAWAELIAGRDLLATTESPLYRSFALLSEAMLALRFKKDTAQAAAALRAVEREPTALARVRVIEQLELWWGLIGLLDGDDSAAVERLRAATDLMDRTERWMMLPTAAVYLAEAEWRAGNEEASDAAANLALETSTAIGSTHSLVRALADFPGVLSRRLDLELDQDGRWHDVGRTLMHDAESPARLRRSEDAHLMETGTATLRVGSRLVSFKLLKSVELLSFLAAAGGSAAREDVLDALFESKTDKSANAYLRMAVNGARTALDDPQCIGADRDRVWWAAGSLGSDFVDLQIRLRRLRNVTGNARLRLAMEALESVGDHVFLDGARSRWAVEQRASWLQLVLDTTHAAAEAAWEVSDYGLAHRLVSRVLTQDPYRERAWRLAMRIAAAVGDGDRVLALYRQCETALAEVPALPAGSTRRLLETLRA